MAIAEDHQCIKERQRLKVNNSYIRQNMEDREPLTLNSCSQKAEKDGDLVQVLLMEWQNSRVG